MGGMDVAYRSQSRYNGWTCPPHPFQFIAWGAYLYFGLFYFTCTVPGLLDQWQPPSYVIMAVLFVVHVVVHLLACSVNPADPSVLRRMRKGQREVGRFDRTQHRHVIENQHCYLCEVDVGVRSKHCSTCNKCVSDFDHHCKWLNNCVGGRNYRLFVATLASAIAGCVMVLVLGLVQFVAYYKDRHKGQILKPYQELLEGSNIVDGAFSSQANVSTTEFTPNDSAEFKLFYQTVPDIAWQVLVMFTTILAALGTGLLAHLLGFHVYLMCNGLNTYDYIVQEREKSEKAAREREVEEAPVDTARSRNKHNRVRPDETELSSRHTARGGIDENAVMESSRVPRDTAPPTPPPPVRDGYRDYHEAPVQKRKKKKENRKSSTYHGNNSRSPGYPNNHGNYSRSPGYPSSHGNHINGHIPVREDTADLAAAIRKSLEEKGDGILSDDNLGPSSVQDVAVAVRKPSPVSILSLWPAEDPGYLTTDSGCDVEQESPGVGPGPGSVGSGSSPPPAVHVERLQLPHSSDDSDYSCSNSRPKERSSRRGLASSGPRLYHTLPSIGSTVPRYDSDSGESLQEIPVSSTRRGRAGSLRGVGPEIGYPPPPPSQAPTGPHKHKSSRDKSRGRRSTLAGVENLGASLGEEHPSVDRSLDLEPTPRPPRHRDVPPLDLSPFNESEAEPSTRRGNVGAAQNASKI